MHYGVECPINAFCGNWWCFCFGPWPRAAVGFCFVLFAWDDTQIWLGDLHFVWLGVVLCFWVNWHRRLCVVQTGLGSLGPLFAFLNSLSSFQDRAFELYRPHSGKKYLTGGCALRPDARFVCCASCHLNFAYSYYRGFYLFSVLVFLFSMM